MPYSTDFGKTEIKAWIENHFDLGTACLDVGAGSGTWAKLLRNHLIMDACEIFPDYVTKFKLEQLYNKIFITNIIDFNYNYYDIIIFGDIIEHLSVSDAQAVIRYAKDHSRDIIVGVPFSYKQGICNNNAYEIHIQDDLTNDLVLERYPELEPIIINNYYGYYHFKDKK